MARPESHRERVTAQTDQRNEVSSLGQIHASALRTRHDDTFHTHIERWIEQRTALAFQRDEQGRPLAARIAELDRSFIQHATEHFPEGRQSHRLNYFFTFAREQCYRTEQHLLEKHLLEGTTIRKEIEKRVTNRWEQIGWMRAQPDSRQRIQESEHEYAKKKDIFTDTLCRQLQHATGNDQVSHRELVEKTLESIAKTAEQIGEKRYLTAHENAVKLYQALPGRAQRSHQLFVTLARLSEQERRDALEVFRHSFQKDFSQYFSEACNSTSTKIKNFFKIPALKAALEEQFGLGVGLLKAGGHIFPHPKNWRAYLAKIKTSIAVVFLATKKVLIPYLRDREKCKEQLAGFFQKLTQKAESPEKARVDAMLKGECTEAAVHSFLLLLWDNDPQCRDELVTMLSSFSPEQLTELEQDFTQRYSPQVGGRTLRQALSLYIPEKDALILEAHLDGDPDLALCKELDYSLKGKKYEQIAALQKCTGLSQERIDGLKEAFLKTKNHHPDRNYLSQFLKGPLLDWADASLNGLVLDAAAARLECALRRISGEWPGIVFYDTPEEEDKRIIDHLGVRYGTDFWQVFRKQYGKERTRIMHTLIEEGEVSVAYQVRHCITGLGADTVGLRALLAERSPKFIEHLSKRYSELFHRMELRPERILIAGSKGLGALLSSRSIQKASHQFIESLKIPRDLDEDITNNLCGFNRFDIQTYCRGTTNNPEILYQRFLERYQFEHAGNPYQPPKSPSKKSSLLTSMAPSFLRNLMQKLQRKNELARNKTEACLVVHNYYHRHIVNQSPDSHDKKHFSLLVRHANQTFDLYRDMQARRAETFANIGAIGTSTAASFGILVLHLPYATTAMVVGTSSLAGRSILKKLIKGDGYGRREGSRDLFLAAVDGPTIALGNFIKAIRAIRVLGIGRTALSSGVKFAFKKSLHYWGSKQITHAILESKESIHTRRAVQGQELSFLSTYGKLLHAQQESYLRKRMAKPQQSKGINRVFRLIGRELIAREDS